MGSGQGCHVAHGKEGIGTASRARVSGHFGAGPGCKVSRHFGVRQRGRASGHFVVVRWVVFQKKCQSKNQSQSTARGEGPAESSREYYGGSGGDSPQTGGDGHHKVQMKRVVVMVTTGATKLDGGDGHHRD